MRYLQTQKPPPSAEDISDDDDGNDSDEDSSIQYCNSLGFQLGWILYHKYF